MKKRKKPYLLVTLLVIVGIAVGVMNTPPSHNQPTQDPTPQTGQDVKVDDKPSDIAKNVNSKVSGKGTQPTSPAEMMAKLNPDSQTSGPLVLKSKPTAQTYKPMPSDSSTSTQWYVDETPKEFKKPTSQAPGTPPPAVVTSKGGPTDR